MAAIVEDVDGNRFLDFSAGTAVVATGHCHPRVVQAIQEGVILEDTKEGTRWKYS